MLVCAGQHEAKNGLVLGSVRNKRGFGPAGLSEVSEG